MLANANFRGLWAAKICSQAGTQISRVSLILAFARTSNSVVIIASLICCEVLPGVITSFLSGTIADRGNKRFIMVASDLSRMVLAMVAMIWPVTWVIFMVVAAQSIGFAFFNPARSSALPLVVDPDTLPEANALDQGASTTVLIVGPALAASLFYSLGLRATLAIDALTYLVSALFILGIKIPKTSVTNAPEMLWQTVTEGWRYLNRHSLAKQIVWLGVISLFCVGLWVPLAPVFARTFLHSSEATISVQMTVFGIGGLCAAPIIPRLSRVVSKGALMAACLLGEALIMFLYSFTAIASASTALIFVWGATVMGISVASVSLIQESVAQSHLGRVFAIIEQTESSATLLAILGAVLLQRVLSPERIFTTAAVFYFVFVGVVLLSTRGHNILRTGLSPAPGLLQDAI